MSEQSPEDPMPLAEEGPDAEDDLLNSCVQIEIPPAPLPVQSLDVTGPRLMITQIVTENFKSYGGMRVMGPFHKNFSCIIGPNGSGKSNVIDSMLFVFGYRASKVRSKKLSQLIHQSELIPHANSCMVAVHFQKIIDRGHGPDDYEVVPDSLFVVSRRAYRDNSSSYWIDKTRAVYRDVASLLRRHGIDLDHNRFLILQGEVEQIALMKPKAPSEHEDGFLEYLEDIIGSSRFKEPLTTYSSRIDRLNDLRLEKLARVKNVEREKDELEGVRNEAMDYLRLVNRLIRLKNVLFQKHLAKERATESEKKALLATGQAECQTLTNDIQEKSREVTELQTELESIGERHSQLLIKHRESKAKFSEYEAEDSRLRDEHAHVKATGRRLAKLLQGERAKLEDLERQPKEADDRRETIKRQLIELEETKKKHEAAYQETVDNLAKETGPLRAKVEKAEETLAPLQTEADEYQSKFALEKQQFDLTMAGQRRELDRADVASRGADAARKKLADSEAQLLEAQKRLAPSGSKANRRSGSVGGGLHAALAAASRDLNDVKSQEAKLTDELNKLRIKLAESKAAVQADNSRGLVLRSLLEAKRSGTIPGILGRLGDLGAIPPQYDVAVSTACSALDNIVTDTMDTAQQAVTYLKRNNLGQATFIGLDKMQKWANKASSPFSVPQSSFQAKRLFDLVETANPEVRPAFYYALRDTLVANDLDSATKLAFDKRQRHRVVTLHGQLIETSGAMSGGGGRPASGRMLTSINKVREIQRRNDRNSVGGRGDGQDSFSSHDAGNNPDQLAALEKQLSQGDVDLARMRESRARLEEMVTRMTRERDDAERTVKRCEMECSHLRAEVDALTTEATQASNRAKTVGPSQSEQKRLKAELSKLEAEMNRKSERAKKKLEEVEKLKAELLDVGSARLTAVRNRLSAIEKNMKETNDQLTKLEVSVKTAARNYQKAKNKIENLEAEVEATSAKLVSVDEQMTSLLQNGHTCMAEFNKIQADVEELQKLKDESQLKLTERQAELVSAQKAETNARRQLAQLESELAQAQANARHWQRELRGLRLHRVDDDDGGDDEGNEDAGQTATDHSTQQTADLSSTQPSQLDPTDATAVLNSPNSAQTVGLSTPKSQTKSTKLVKYTTEQLDDISVDMHEMKCIEERIANMAPNMAAIEEFRRKVETYLRRVGELNHVTTVLGEQRKLRDDAKGKRLSEFMDGFHSITSKLKEMYQMITQGGDAELELIDSLDPFSEGIVFSVRPPKKSWKNIANLSGGEKTLSSLALVFALHHYKPTPLYVMDEIDAALDFKNVSIVGNYLKERTKNAQFIVISLRNNMFELSDRLVGIYKTFNITKTITLNPGPMMDQLSQLIVRVAVAQGREKELRLQQQQQQQQLQQQNQQQQEQLLSRQTQEYQQQQQHQFTTDRAYPPSQMPLSQPTTVTSDQLLAGNSQSRPIKLCSDSPILLDSPHPEGSPISLYTVE